MARQVVVLAFLLLAVVQVFAVAAAASSTPAPAYDYNDDYDEPPTDGAIGVLEAADSPISVVAAPLGGPVPPGAFVAVGAGSSDASTLRISAFAGAAALAAGALYL